MIDYLKRHSEGLAFAASLALVLVYVLHFGGIL